MGPKSAAIPPSYKKVLKFRRKLPLSLAERDTVSHNNGGSMNAYPIDMASRIRESYRRATEEQRLSGTLWYDRVRLMAEQLASRYNRPLFQVVGVIAALSPRNKFARNMQDAESILRDGERAVVATFGSNKTKALRILAAQNHDEVYQLLNGNKVRSFYMNILLFNDMDVTIDVWMLRLMGIDGTLTDRRYEDVAHTVRHVARELGVQPKHLQAITWVELRGAAF